MVRRRAAMVVGETRDQKTGSSLYSRMGTIHMSTSCSRMRRGSTRSRRISSHSCRSSACSRSVPNGRSWAAAGTTTTGMASARISLRIMVHLRVSSS